MRPPFDIEAVQRRFERLFANSDAQLIEHWPAEKLPDRTSIWRWHSGKPLKTKENLLSFAGALDLDPFALWTMTDDEFHALCSKVVQALREGKWSSNVHPSLKYVKEFIGPTNEWPPEDIARRYYRRTWKTKPFQHTPASDRPNYFAKIALTAGPPPGGDLNQVWHFAWSEPLDPPIWRPYGFIRLDAERVRLYHFGGYVVERPARRSQIVVETWFGQEAADFLIASLHPFEFEIIETAPADAVVVRFGDW